jgi:mRNA interferase RelE/StbE
MSNPPETSASRYTVSFHRDLESELRRLPKPYIRRILQTIESLAINPRPHGSEKITGHDLWKMRVGVYRLIYAIDDANHQVRTYRVGHRRDIYCDL